MTVPVQQAMDDAPAANAGQPADDASVLDLGSCLTIAEVGELGARMVHVFDRGAEVVLEGGEIEQIDGAGIQLLAALMKEAARRQQRVRWAAGSPVVEEAARQLGLAELLQLPREQ
ncbi:MAG TPA: STAS domain-containing protein [Sedimenticola thiotaurini]|uniref:STAS domain-containing protein n=1 Tax=Sedimenticola thiotaurini TaxID=1543721 RepID=A0A831RKV8_9GAMM|nr:STAS domain-containing protein [Sedimenticola thiotaurini]